MRYRCTNSAECECKDKEMKKDEVMEHLENDCGYQKVECVACEVDYQRAKFSDGETHNCF